MCVMSNEFWIAFRKCGIVSIVEKLDRNIVLAARDISKTRQRKERGSNFKEGLRGKWVISGMWSTLGYRYGRCWLPLRLQLKFRLTMNAIGFDYSPFEDSKMKCSSMGCKVAEQSFSKKKKSKRHRNPETQLFGDSMKKIIPSSTSCDTINSTSEYLAVDVSPRIVDNLKYPLRSTHYWYYFV